MKINTFPVIMKLRKSLKSNRVPLLIHMNKLIISSIHLKRRATISIFVNNKLQDIFWIDVCRTPQAKSYLKQATVGSVAER